MKKYICLLIFLILLSGCSTTSTPTVEPSIDPTYKTTVEPSINPTDKPNEVETNIDLTKYKEETLFDGKLHYYVKDPLPEDVIVVFNPELETETQGTVARILVYTEKPFDIWIEDYWIVTNNTEGLDIIYEENGYYVEKNIFVQYYDTDEEISTASKIKEKYAGTVIFTNE